MEECPEVLELQHYMVFQFEKNFNPTDARLWFKRYWLYLIPFCILFTIFCRWLENYMRNRKPILLKRPFIVYAVSMTFFCLMTFLRVISAFLSILSQPHGVYKLYCVTSYLENDNVVSFWLYTYLFARAVEFIDILFIALRKGSRMYIVIYHHICFALITWYLAGGESPIIIWFVSIHSLFHVTYFGGWAAKWLGIGKNSYVGMTFTVLLFISLSSGIVVPIYGYLYYIGFESQCALKPSDVAIASVTCIQYLILTVMTRRVLPGVRDR